MSDFTVYKRDHAGLLVWQYTGQAIARGRTWVCIVARFMRATVDIGPMIFETGDLMTEWFYSDRYYNVFRVQQGDGGPVKGWYCNITRPAEIGEDYVASDDLALDMIIKPDRTVILMDEDEYHALALPRHEQEAVERAVESLRQQVANHEGPFAPLS